MARRAQIPLSPPQGARFRTLLHYHTLLRSSLHVLVLLLQSPSPHYGSSSNSQTSGVLKLKGAMVDLRDGVTQAMHVGPLRLVLHPRLVQGQGSIATWPPAAVDHSGCLPLLAPTVPLVAAASMHAVLS